MRKRKALAAILLLGMFVISGNASGRDAEENAALPPRGYIVIYELGKGTPKSTKKGILDPETINKWTGGLGFWHVAYSLGAGYIIHAVPDKGVWVDRIDLCGVFEAFDIGASPEQLNIIERSLFARRGQKYDALEALTKGRVDLLAGPICTSFLIDAFKSALNLLPEQGKELARLLKSMGRERFVSANGLARYFRAHRSEDGADRKAEQG
ncbi:MAG: hypothetical protein GXP25_06820 [Planctomycetes bacterium]|nr:hypothetical protein [Planctomycetota bacterium]